jgi:hypothetical protein
MSTTRFSVSINKELHGFLDGSRGLRQGSLLSPYFFVLVMEVFSRMMGRLGRDQNFKYHWRYEREQLTHLCFSDDLMIFF